MPQDDASTPIFEIDQPEIYSQFFLTREVEILSYLRALEKQHAIVTIYVDDAHRFFLSSIVAVDERKSSFFLDLANTDELRRVTEKTPQLTLTATLDKVKIQIRASHQKVVQQAGRSVLGVPLPQILLRLQRREFFRLETPHASPLHCKLARPREDGSMQLFNLPLLDISGGGISLMGSTGQADQFPPGTIFRDCRLEIPGEGFIAVNLCVRKVAARENRNGQDYLRIGCEFVSLPGTRLAHIQRYITRIERERKARDSGLD